MGQVLQARPWLRPRSHGTSMALVTVCVAIAVISTLCGVARSTFSVMPQVSGRAAPVTVAPAAIALQLPRAARWVHEVALRAEEQEASTIAEEDLPALTPLFQELIVSNRTTPKSLSGAIIAIFNRGEKAVDLILIDPRCKSTLMYAINFIPDAFRASAQIMPRRRDRRLRVRVFLKFQPLKDSDAEVFRISKSTNVTKLGRAMKNRFVDFSGNNLARTVELQFAGRESSSLAMLAIEHAGHYLFRELVFQPRFFQMKPPEGKSPEGDEASDIEPEVAGNNNVGILVTVTAT